MIRKWLSLLLILSLVFSAVPCPAETAEGDGTLEYIYTFTPGTLLDGEGTKQIRELLDAIEVRFYRQRAGRDDIIRLQLVSEGDEAFSLTAGETDGSEFALTCSLLGGNKLTLRRDQLSSFLLTLVQALADQGFVKGDQLVQMNALADRMGKLLGEYLDKAPDQAPDTGIDLTPYLAVMTRNASATERREIPPEERDETGAVVMTSYLVSEAQRQHIVNRALDKVLKLPVLGDELKKGTLKIGNQVITDGFLRSVFADTPGEVSMDVWQDEDGQLVRLLLHTPDLSGLVTDPQFSKTQGLGMSIARTRGEGKRLTSVTTFNLPGLEGDLLTMRLERLPGAAIPPMKSDKVHPVGDMNSAELMQLIRSMGWVIVANAANMILTLPRCVAEMLIRKIIK